VQVANVAAERSFSGMRNMSLVRNSVKEQLLSVIATLSIEFDMAKNINIDEVVDTFSKLPSLYMSTRRIVKWQQAAYATYVRVAIRQTV